MPINLMEDALEEKFDNNKYTAAHKKTPWTKVKVTNEKMASLWL
jgi:rare lipoprotein A (peptidoglycan hydrolase)